MATKRSSKKVAGAAVVEETGVEETADRLHSAAIHLLRRLRVTDAASGLTGPRLSALSVVVFAGPVTVGELASAEQVRAPTITRLVDGLARDGLVVREADAADARRVWIVATAAGARLLKAGRARRVRELARQMAGLSVDERQCLARAAGMMEGMFGARGR
jgi:DNA-binding MarR family transcriptional regulator